MSPYEGVVGDAVDVVETRVDVGLLVVREMPPDEEGQDPDVPFKAIL